MMLHHSLTRKLRCTGFSLVEVSIAIAVAGISIFAVVGLMPSLLDYDQKSGANSVIPTLATQAVSSIKKDRARAGGTVNLNPGDLYFTQEGALLLPTNVDHTNHPDAIYKCSTKLDRIGSILMNASGVNVPDPGDHTLYATLTFTWPVGTDPNPQRTRIIQTTITGN